MRDKRNRIWRSALARIAKLKSKQTTAAELAEDLDMSHSAACGLLKRLQGWGYMRRAGFRAAGGNGVGRQQIVFAITAKGVKAVAWGKKNA